MAETYKQDEYFAIYSIYYASKEEFKNKELFEKQREEFLNNHCNLKKDYYRFSAKDEEHVGYRTLVRKIGLEEIKGVVLVTIDDVFKINSIKNKLNIKE